MGIGFEWKGTPLALAQLDAIAADLAKTKTPGTASFNYLMQIAIIGHFLGEEWHRMYCSMTAKPKSYFAPHFDETGVAPEYSVRHLLLAELLFNLQDVPGFHLCLANMQLDQIESTFAELQVGAMLKQTELAFAYVDPAMRQGPTYDIEIFRLNTTGCVEIKCKRDRGNYGKGTVRKALVGARRQLPPDGDGIVFIKMPQHWMHGSGGDPRRQADVKMPAEVIRETHKELQKTTRIKRVIYYVFNLAYAAEYGAGVTHYVVEIANNGNPPDSVWNDELVASQGGGGWITFPEMSARWRANAEAG